MMRIEDVSLEECWWVVGLCMRVERQSDRAGSDTRADKLLCALPAAVQAHEDAIDWGRERY